MEHQNRDIPQTTRLVIGAGPIGSGLALHLAEAGDRVRLLSRSGRGPEHPSIDRVAADATDVAALTEAATGAATIFNCANPGSYEHWEREWPPLAAAILAAAEASGAVLVTFGNLYGYGAPDGPMTRHTPLRPNDHKGALRARMWEDARAAQETGRVRVTEVRASDYLGPTEPTTNGMLPRYANDTLRGRPASVFTDVDQPHSWAYDGDIVRTLAAVADDERAWGSAWIVPTNPPISMRELLRELGAVVDAGEPRLRRVPRWQLAALGAIVPVVRELRGVAYQFDAPFVSDGSETTARFGIEPTPWADVLPETARAWHERAVAG
ncbi:NAD-dependent epimerase [Agromyces rhizosphaerae]|uniref:NAD-dependent epimerase n=1 Tax=Agromyces rhizosphaerae TaxID=88374 RepID=A0A9W6CYV7_9MICO|nr:NAD-dependent epimerase/dehydratase family protein [Agromyces rhizosphaerae]GLI26378.1 NAD-dependent epimerase [Agromyces rhizosphaerae]